MRKLLLAAAVAAGLVGCGREPETGVPPSTLSDSAILADTAKRDVVDLDDIRPPGVPDPVIVTESPGTN
jgi:hypothetical protein